MQTPRGATTSARPTPGHLDHSDHSSAGATGTDGADGQGVPTGGATGQVLKKTSATDYESGGGGGGGATDTTNTLIVADYALSTTQVTIGNG